MTLPWIVAIVLLVFGIVVGNIMLLKYSAKMSMKKPSPSNEKERETDNTSQ